jgi:hypothetical protein
LKDKVINSNIGILLIAKNKRNTKDKNKLSAFKLSSKKKNIIKKAYYNRTY